MEVVEVVEVLVVEGGNAFVVGVYVVVGSGFGVLVVLGGGGGGGVDVFVSAGGEEESSLNSHVPVMTPRDAEAKKSKRPVDRSSPPNGHPIH